MDARMKEKREKEGYSMDVLLLTQEGQFLLLTQMWHSGQGHEVQGGNASTGTLSG